MNKFTSRKFWLAVVFQSVFTAMMYFGKMPPDIFENLAYMILGGYFISNVSQKVFSKETK